MEFRKEKENLKQTEQKLKFPTAKSKFIGKIYKTIKLIPFTVEFD